jgi:hypothetical protein
MTTTGDVAKGILIFCCAYFDLILIVQAVQGRTALAVFMLVGLLIPISITIHGYVKDKSYKKNSSNNSAQSLDPKNL